MSVRDAINRKITERFIWDNPIDLNMMRRQRISTLAGGWAWSDPVSQVAQIFTMVVAGRSAPEITMDDGQVVVPTHTLVGHIDANVQKGDQFIHNGKNYEVIQVTSARRDWAMRAMVVERGDGKS